MAFFIITGLLDLAEREKPNPKFGDDGFLSGIPCGAPCLWGITIDQTTEDGVRETLKAKGISSECSTNIDESGDHGIICNSRGYVAFGFPPNGQIVNSIQFIPGKTITLHDAIEKYGPPNLVIDMPCCNTERPQNIYYLFYNELHMELELTGQELMQCDLEPTNAIVYITYRSLVEYKNRMRIFTDNPWVSYQGQWNGYGKCK
jgi:hypothetical protein